MNQNIVRLKLFFQKWKMIIDYDNRCTVIETEVSWDEASVL